MRYDQLDTDKCFVSAHFCQDKLLDILQFLLERENELEAQIINILLVSTHQGAFMAHDRVGYHFVPF